MQVKESDIVLDPTRKSGHWYQVKGYGIVPSVTTIIGATLPKAALAAWGKRVALDSIRSALLERPLDVDTVTPWPAYVESIITEASARPDKIRDDAANFGTRAHAYISDWINGYTRPVQKDLEPCLKGFKDWVKGNDVSIDRSEVRLFSAKLKCAGSADLIGRRSAKRFVGDIKTSKGIWLDHKYQVGGGYAPMWDEMFGDEHGRIDEAWIIRLPKTEDDPVKFEAKKIKSLTAAKEGFRLLRRMFDLNKGQHFSK